MGSTILPPPNPDVPGQLRMGANITHKLHPGQRLVLDVPADAEGHVLRIETNPGEERPNERTELPNGSNTLGPFEDMRCFHVFCTLGTINVRVTG